MNWSHEAPVECVHGVSLREHCDKCSAGYVAARETRAAPPPENPKEAFGRLKPPLGLVPAAALVHMSLAMGDGARKYGPYNWRENPVEAMTYLHAAQRHIAAFLDGERLAADSGVHHLGHAMASLAILLDAHECGMLNDNRPKPGGAPALISAHTKAITP